MGIVDKLRSAMSPQKRLIAELADIAGRNEVLAQRLAHHAAICNYPNIKAGLDALAQHEDAHARVLRTILADRNTWPQLPDDLGREGSSNWERLNLDLAALTLITMQIHRAAAQWEGVDQTVADKLDGIAREDDERESDLRRLAIKCDPQALD